MGTADGFVRRVGDRTAFAEARPNSGGRFSSIGIAIAFAREKRAGSKRKPRSDASRGMRTTILSAAWSGADHAPPGRLTSRRTRPRRPSRSRCGAKPSREGSRGRPAVSCRPTRAATPDRRPPSRRAPSGSRSRSRPPARGRGAETPTRRTRPSCSRLHCRSRVPSSSRRR